MIRRETDNESLLKTVDYLTRAIRVSLSQIRYWSPQCHMSGVPLIKFIPLVREEK